VTVGLAENKWQNSHSPYDVLEGMRISFSHAARGQLCRMDVDLVHFLIQ
jgi:hypothetical protein